MTNALTIRTEGEFAVMLQQADALVKSGFLPQSVNTPQKAVAIFMMGRELGIGPWQAINGINVIQGKPTISPQLMLALINRSGELADMKVDGDKARCTVTMTRKGRSPHTETFTMQDAEAQGLKGKSNWQKMPEIMLKWRAVSACARVVFPDVIIGFYTPEEMNPDLEIDDATGEVVQQNIAPEPNPAPPPAALDGEVTDEQPASKTPALDRHFGPRENEPDTSDIKDLLDKPMNGLQGAEMYRVRQYSLAHSGTNAERHWSNRFDKKFGKKAALNTLTMTVAEFVQEMATPSDEPDTEKEAA